MILCATADIVEGQGRGFVYGSGLEREAMFVIRWRGTLLGYRNLCPHVGTPLDWPENRFFDTEGHYICGSRAILACNMDRFGMEIGIIKFNDANSDFRVGGANKC